MGEAVEERAGEALAAEDLGPFIEGEVAGDEGGTAFVALGEESAASTVRCPYASIGWLFEFFTQDGSCLSCENARD